MTTVLGWTIEEYRQAILGAMHEDYEWYSPEMLKSIDKVTIQKISGLAEENGLKTPEEAVEAVCHDIRQQIEWSPEHYLKYEGSYKVPFEPQELGGGWMLEDYTFRKYEGGVYLSSVTGGDRWAGSSRSFYIPGRFMKGHTYEEFLNAYFSEIAPPGAFGLGTEELLGDSALKAFLGFGDS